MAQVTGTPGALHCWQTAHPKCWLLGWVLQDSKLAAHPLFERISEEELAGDPCADLIKLATEEGQKVERNSGKVRTMLDNPMRSLFPSSQFLSLFMPGMPPPIDMHGLAPSVGGQTYRNIYRRIAGPHEQ